MFVFVPVVIYGSGRREVCESSRSPSPILDISSRVIRLLSSAPSFSSNIGATSTGKEEEMYVARGRHDSLVHPTS